MKSTRLRRPSEPIRPPGWSEPPEEEPRPAPADPAHPCDDPENLSPKESKWPFIS